MGLPRLFPGDEYCKEFISKDNKKKIEYAYCSESGRFFSCVTSSASEAREKCEYWLLRQERN